jgi:hypothetical protein
MTAVRVFAEQQVDSRNVTSDATHLMSDEVLVAVRNSFQRTPQTARRADASGCSAYHSTP